MLFTTIQTGYIILTILCLTAIVYGFGVALKRTEADQKTRKKLLIRTCMGTFAWLALVSTVSFSGFIQDFNSFPPRLFLFLWLPVLALIWLLNQKRTGALLRGIPPQWLMYIQIFRVPVELMLWGQFILGLTPIQMTFEGLNYDILAGISGPLVGLFIAYTPRWSTTIGLLWNVACLGLLINIVAIAILSAPGPLQVFTNAPANTLITHFPFAFLPLVLVPVAYFMHALSIKQLLLIRKEQKSKRLVIG